MKTSHQRPRRVYTLILALARCMKSFNPENLTPALTREQANRNCLALYRLGELVRLKRGTPGNGGRSAEYKLVGK